MCCQREHPFAFLFDCGNYASIYETVQRLVNLIDSKSCCAGYLRVIHRSSTLQSEDNQPLQSRPQ